MRDARSAEITQKMNDGYRSENIVTPHHIICRNSNENVKF